MYDEIAVKDIINADQSLAISSVLPSVIGEVHQKWMQEQELQEPKQYFTGEKKKEIPQSSEKENMISCNLDSKKENKHSQNQKNNSGGDSLLSIFSLGDSNSYDATQAEDIQAQKRKKKKKKGIRR